MTKKKQVKKEPFDLVDGKLTEAQRKQLGELVQEAIDLSLEADEAVTAKSRAEDKMYESVDEYCKALAAVAKKANELGVKIEFETTREGGVLISDEDQADASHWMPSSICW